MATMSEHFISIVFYVNYQIFVHSGTVCRTMLRNICGLVNGGWFSCKSVTGMDKLLFKCGNFCLILTIALFHSIYLSIIPNIAFLAL